MANTIEKWANNARTTLAGSLSNVATSVVLQSGAGALFPSPNNLIGEFAKATLQDAATGLRNEIVYITARTGDVLTVTRGQDGTTAQTWSAGDTVFEGITAATLAGFVQPVTVQTNTLNHATAGGAADAITVTYTPAYTAWVDGMTFFVKITTANTTTTPTVSVNGLTAKTIVKSPSGGVGMALAAGDLRQGMIAEFKYSGTLDQVICQNQDDSTKYVPTGTVLEYTGNGAAPAGYVFDGSVLSRAAYPALFALYVTNSGFTSQTFTATIASPAVFTKTAHGFTGGERLRLSTTGALPTGLTTTTDYFVEKIDANTFYLTTSVFGIATRITTSGTQSGTHTYMQSLYGLGDGSTTFNTPDMRGLFTRGLDGGRGIDSGRAMGTVQKGSIMPSDTNYSDAAFAVGISTSSIITPLLTMGQDALNVNDYVGVAMLAATVYESYGATMSSNGVARPSNIVVQHIIKY
jgi:microcystin-dependent protein